MADPAVAARLLESYEGVESAESFDSPAALAAYRESLLTKTRAEAAYLVRHAPRRPFSLLESCSGNGRLLHALALGGHLEAGEGWEISASRVAFADAWARDLALGQRVRHVRTNSLAPPPGRKDHDVAACITGALGYFDAIEDGGALRLLRTLRARVRVGAVLVLELYQHPAEIALCRASPTREARVWRELDAKDPWRFYLSHFRYDEARATLHHHKVFVHRSTGRVDDRRYEALRVWTRPELEGLVADAGFDAAAAHADWDEQPYKEAASDHLVLRAKAV